jgi:sugar/nucleoside kinase (ribokinase family)
VRTPADWDLLVAGRPSVDVIFSGLETWPALGRDILAEGLGVCAGTSFNTPAAANRLGLRVGYIAMVGNDRWSQIVREEWDAEGLPTDFLRIEDRAMPFVSVALNDHGDRGFVTYYGADESDDDELDGLALRVVGSASARHLHAYAGEDHTELVRTARERGMTVSLDAWGGPWWDAPAPLASLLEDADVVLANGDEALAMTGENDLHRAAASLGKHSPIAVVKLGARGAIALVDGRLVDVPAEPAEIADTTGAGDCFNAGFLRGWLADLPVEHCLTLAGICGARAVETFGGYRGCPREGELREIAASRSIALPPVRGGTS